MGRADVGSVRWALTHKTIDWMAKTQLALPIFLAREINAFLHPLLILVFTFVNVCD